MKQVFGILLSVMCFQSASAKVIWPTSSISDGAKDAVVQAFDQVIREGKSTALVDCAGKAKGTKMLVYNLDGQRSGATEHIVKLIGMDESDSTAIKVEMTIHNYDVYHSDRYDLENMECSVNKLVPVN